MTVNVGLESSRRVGQVVVIKPVRSPASDTLIRMDW